MRVAARLLFSALAATSSCATSRGARSGDADLADLLAQAPTLPQPFERKAMPGFDGGKSWVNVDHPLHPRELRRHVVVVDFWTSCCINCIQTLPTLRALEERFRPEEVVVIGVESPKFSTERGRERLSDVVRTLGIRHPVVLDAEMSIWEHWGVHAWPTVLVLDVEGKRVFQTSGEPNRAALFGAVARAVSEARAEGTIADQPVRGLGAPPPEWSRPLLYPEKVTPLSGGGLAVADTGHNRVVLLDRAGRPEAEIGSGRAGAADGPFAKAELDHPRGLAELGGRLYVADTGNQRIREVDLSARTVRTVAGSGQLGSAALAGTWQPATQVALRSPWDLAAGARTIFVALAGSHQIAELDPARGAIRAFAGNGSEARVDGAPGHASFAQPSGLALAAGRLYVADSESSSVRAVDLATAEVRTVVGRGLFVFGDQDGPAAEARLQHPLGVAFAQGALYVTDTYNSKLRRIDPQSGQTATLAGGPSRDLLSEPGGLAVRGSELVIADTDHHRLVSVPLGGGPPVAWIPAGLGAPDLAVAGPPAERRPAEEPARVELGPVPIAAAGATSVRLTWDLPAGTDINDEAPFALAFPAEEGLSTPPTALEGGGAKAHGGIVFAVQAAPGAQAAWLDANLSIVVCDVASHRVCVPARRRLRLRFLPQAGPRQPPEARLAVALPDARAP